MAKLSSYGIKKDMGRYQSSKISLTANSIRKPCLESRLLPGNIHEPKIESSLNNNLNPLIFINNLYLTIVSYLAISRIKWQKKL